MGVHVYGDDARLPFGDGVNQRPEGIGLERAGLPPEDVLEVLLGDVNDDDLALLIRHVESHLRVEEGRLQLVEQPCAI